jgi:2-polyprenyl-3-methyl-5-hydroxy-6-metoxy-1,4-benzoquinol methylase
MNENIVSGLYFQKSKPYLPVARYEKDGVHYFLEDFNYNEIMEVAGVGMGLCLIKADVFKKLSYPYFKFEWVTQGEETFQLAEDLYFCDQAREAGYSIKLNTGILLEHDGAPIGAAHFNIYKEQLAIDKKDREELIEDLSKFEKLDEDEIKIRLKDCQKLRNNEFDLFTGGIRNPENLDNYYRNNSYEIYDHFAWHIGNRRNYDKQLVEEIKALYPSKATEILDFGCGGGQIAFMLVSEGYQVTVMDKNKKSLDFISYRFEKRKKKVKIVPLPLHPQFKNKYDVILCFDVLEHIPDNEFKNVIEQIKSLKKEKGRVFATVSFGAQDIHKSHFDSSPEKEDLILGLG